MESANRHLVMESKCKLTGHAAGLTDKIPGYGGGTGTIKSS